MTRGTLMMVEPQLVVLSPEALAKVGYDCPPIQAPSPVAAPAERQVTRRKSAPRALREVRRHMTYHWF